LNLSYQVTAAQRSQKQGGQGSAAASQSTAKPAEVAAVPKQYEAPVAPVIVEVNFNRQQFNKECKLILEQIKERFIDLSPTMLDDETSNYVD